MGFYIPQKSTMIEQLKADGHWMDVSPDDFDKTIVTKNREPSIHFVTWLYCFKYSQYVLCQQVREILNRRGIDVFRFCILIAQICARSYAKIHIPTVPLNAEELRDGLKMYGLSDKRLLDCVEVLQEMKTLPASK